MSTRRTAAKRRTLDELCAILSKAKIPPVSVKQLRSIVTAQRRVNVFDGAIRAGKTIASLLAFLIFVAMAPRGGQLVVIARTRESAMRNVFAPLMDESLFGPIARQIVYTGGAPSAKILGRTVYVIGASDAKAEKVLRGLTVAGAYVDEITVIPEEFFTQLLGRMSVKGARLFGTTNPDNPAHWLKVKFLDRIPADGIATETRPLDDWTRTVYVMRDNPSLDESYLQSVAREFVGLWYRRFVLGEWVAGEGAIWDMWDPEGHTGKAHVVPWAKLPPIRRMLGVAIDYGTTHATVAVMLALGYDRNLYIVDELRLDPKHQQIRLTDAEQAQRIKTWLRTQTHLPEGNWLQPETVICDQAGASLREELSRQSPGQHGAPLHTEAADKSVAYGLSTVANLLGQRRLFIAGRDAQSGRGCESLQAEIPSYSWDPDAAKRGDDKPIKVADDAVDAMRYSVTTLENVWREELALAA